MKTITKLMLAGTALAAAGAANAATIGVIPTANGGSDLVLFVTDTTTQAQFIQDLGVNVDSLGVTTASANADYNNGIAYNSFGIGAGPLNNPVAVSSVIGAGGVDSALASFLSANSGNFVYGIEGAAIGDGSINPGQGRVVATFTAANAANLLSSEPSTLQAQGAAQQVNSFFIAVNNGTNGVFGAASGTGAQNTSIIATLADASLGTAMNLNEVVTQGGNDANVYASSTAINVSAGGVITGFASAGGTAPVPLPAAIWLLGSGLVGLFGIGRRRLSVQAASVQAA